MQSPPLSSQGPPNKSAREGRQNKMPTANERELARLSLESGVAVKDIEAKLKELLKGGLDDEGAMAVWKSDNSSKLGGRIVKDALLRVVSSEKPRTVENDDGSTTKVGSFSAFVVDGEKIAFAGFSLWREKADLTASIVPGQLYKADVKLRDNPKDGGNRGTLLTDLNEASEEEGKVIPTENVRAALAAVEAGNVEAGIVYKTDAAISKKVRVAFEVPRQEGPVISYPMALLKESKRPDAARKFLDYLAGDEAAQVFQKFGFILLETPKEK